MYTRRYTYKKIHQGLYWPGIKFKVYIQDKSYSLRCSHAAQKVNVFELIFRYDSVLVKRYFSKKVVGT